jgi:hypothetical protein
VLAEVVQHVHEGIPYLARRAEHAGVISVAPDSATPPEHPIHGFRDADCEPTDTALEARRLVCFDQEMQVVNLNAEVQDAKSFATG